MTCHSNKNQLRCTHCGSGPSKIETLQGNGSQKATYHLATSCHITLGNYILLGVHKEWCLNSTVAYGLVELPGTIRAAVPALAPVTFTNVWAEAENR